MVCKPKSKRYAQYYQAIVTRFQRWLWHKCWPSKGFSQGFLPRCKRVPTTDEIVPSLVMAYNAGEMPKPPLSKAGASLFSTRFDAQTSRCQRLNWFMAASRPSAIHMSKAATARAIPSSTSACSPLPKRPKT